MKNFYEQIKQHFLNSVERQLKIDNLMNDNELLPTFMDTGFSDQGLTDGSNFASSMACFVLAYYLKDSPYYRNSELLEKAYTGLCRYESYIHEDGSYDLLSTNFHDPAQTGFHVHALYPATELIVKYSQHTPEEDMLFEKIKEVLRKSGHAMATLGFHTPNHRWVICSGLAIAYRYTGEQEFLDAIEAFLREGIDCDMNGEYTERSTGCYNNICNYSFMVMGYYLDREEFFEYPRRNLNLMYKFIEPDYTVNTLNSTRWDNGGEYNIAPYFPHYLMLALIDKNPEFAYMAELIHDKYGNYVFDFRLAFVLTVLTLRPDLVARFDEITPKAPEKDQTCFLPDSRIARIYEPEKNLTMTTLASRSPVFFQMNYGTSILQVRFAGSFFGDPHSQFRARSITQTEDGFKLVCDENAGYRSRFEEKPETSNWRKMDHSKRQTINIQNFHTEITVHFLDDGATIDIETSGCERIPTKLEISMMPGGKFFTESVLMQPKAGDYMLLKKGNARYFIDGLRYFEIENGFAEHWNAEHMRGTFPVNPKKFTVAMTTSTPQKSSITIRAKTLLK